MQFTFKFKTYFEYCLIVEGKWKLQNNYKENRC